MFTRTKADEMLRGTTPSSLAFGAFPCLPYATATEERVSQGHVGNLDSIQKPAFRW